MVLPKYPGAFATGCQAFPTRTWPYARHWPPSSHVYGNGCGSNYSARYAAAVAYFLWSVKIRRGNGRTAWGFDGHSTRRAVRIADLKQPRRCHACRAIPATLSQCADRRVGGIGGWRRSLLASDPFYRCVATCDEHLDRGDVCAEFGTHRIVRNLSTRVAASVCMAFMGNYI